MITLSSCGHEDVTPISTANPTHVEDDPDPKPPKDGHGGRINNERTKTSTKRASS
ncbi:hypothetical protein [Dyadobacter diqingensis]|uniref:hypothetical protein n=1 Tax=Dyadobacter diqingensis TaxID=2938121 RepID=UPI0020C195C0|nr:hypothetical protein [Dyadobacter diqingensis]